MVVNFDKADEPGTHWVAIYAQNKYHAEYFNSYGETAPQPIIDYLKRNFRSVTRQMCNVQSYGSKVCGHYAIFFIFMRSRRKSYSHIERILLNSKNPDQFVEHFVNRHVR